MNDIFSEKVFQALDNYKMLKGVSEVTAALSGGADSMSLLYFLVKNSRKLGITVKAAHVNHNIRGEEALRDELFVKEQCEKLGVDIQIKSADIPALTKKYGVGTEECGRRERYLFFEQLRDGRAGSVTATAHTASDNAETVLLNITRGCGIDGLSGIPPTRGSIIRPLIYCTRSEVEAYCDINNIEYITDSTNLTDEYSRNRIRLDVIPQLRIINPAAENAINRLSQLACADSALLDTIAARELEVCRKGGGLELAGLKKCEEPLIARIIRIEADKKLGIVPERRHMNIISAIINRGSGAVELKKDMIVRVENGLLIFENITIKSNNIIKIFDEKVIVPGMRFEYNGRIFEISEKIPLKNANEHKINKKLLINRLSCGIISCDTVIRNRRSGDVFQAYGRGCTKTVKKLFSEMKLSPRDRETRLLIANGSEVLWIEGVGVSQRAAVSGEDDHCIQISAGGEKSV